MQVWKAESGRVLDVQMVIQMRTEAKIEYRSVVLMEHVQAEGEGVRTGSALGEMKRLCAESLRVRRNMCMVESNHTKA